MKGYFDSYQAVISEIVSMQNLLSDLNESNLHTTTETIKTSKFIQSQENLIILIRIIGRIIKYRKKHLRCFFALIDELFPIITQNLSKKEIMFHFSQKLVFLKLLQDKYLSVEDIISFYGTKNDNLLYFYPEVNEILSKNPDFIQRKEESEKYKDIIAYFKNKEGEKIELEEDPRLQIGNIDKLSVLIQKDDIDSFQQIVSQKNIDIKHQQINITDFEIKKYLNVKSVKLIEYAAFHNSIKIFKFLLMNDSTFSKELFQCAIFGGNSEIIHLSEKALNISQNKDVIEYLNGILSLTVVSHNNELYDYLNENFDHQTDFSLLSESIYCENYSFFFNHYSELENEYNESLKNKEINEKVTKIQNAVNELIVFSAGNYCPFLLKCVINVFKNVDLNNPLYFTLVLSPNAEKDKVTNPLSYAIQMFNNKNAKFLLSFDSVNPNYMMNDNLTPFIWACIAGNIEMVELLYSSQKVDVSQKVKESDENALHIATRFGNLSVVKFLVSLNVFNLEEKSNQGETVIETAARLGYKEIFDFLKEQFSKNGIKVDDNLVLNNAKHFPSIYRNPLKMGMYLYNDLKEPISNCLII